MAARVAVVVLSMFSAGCASLAQTTDDPTPAERATWQTRQFDPSIWPHAHDADLDALHAQTPDSLHDFLPAPGVEARSLDAEIREALQPLYLVHHTERTPTGLLRTFERLQRPDAEWHMYASGWEPNAAFIPDTWWQTFGWSLRAQAAATHEIRQTWVVDRDDIVLGMTAQDVALEAGIMLRLPDPAQPADTEPIGIIVQLNALAANEFETRALTQLIEQGWAVVQIDTRAQIEPPNRREINQAYARVHALRLELNVRKREEYLASLGEPEDAQIDDAVARQLNEQTERELFAKLDVPESAFYVHKGNDLAAHGARIAHQTDVTISQNADAAAAAIQHLEAHRPDLAGKPIIVAGFSAGSLVAPAVAARLGARVRALLLVGAGADLYTIARTSNLSSAGLELSHPSVSGPDEQAEREIGEAYRDHTNLDPYSLAPQLEGLPTLVVLGSFDKVVPSSQGRLLLDRLVGEESIMLPLTHNAIFGVLPGLADRIGQWVEQNAGLQPTNNGP